MRWSRGARAPRARAAFIHQRATVPRFHKLLRSTCHTRPSSPLADRSRNRRATYVSWVYAVTPDDYTRAEMTARISGDALARLVADAAAGARVGAGGRAGAQLLAVRGCFFVVGGGFLAPAPGAQMPKAKRS